MNSAKIKDNILDYLIKSEGHYAIISELTKDLKTDFNLINYYSDYLIEEKMVEARDVTSGAHENIEANRFDKLLTLTSKGIYFRTIDGGFQKKENESRLKNIWLIVKIIAGVFNAICVLFLAYYNLKLVEKQTENQNEIVEKNNTIENLQRIILLNNDSITLSDTVNKTN